MVVGLLEFDRWKIAVGSEPSVVVEPVDVVQGGGFDLFDGALPAVWLDQLVLLQSDHVWAGALS